MRQILLILFLISSCKCTNKFKNKNKPIKIDEIIKDKNRESYRILKNKDLALEITKRNLIKEIDQLEKNEDGKLDLNKIKEVFLNNKSFYFLKNDINLIKEFSEASTKEELFNIAFKSITESENSLKDAYLELEKIRVIMTSKEIFIYNIDSLIKIGDLKNQSNSSILEKYKNKYKFENDQFYIFNILVKLQKVN